MKSIAHLLLLIFGSMLSFVLSANDVPQSGLHFVLPDGRLAAFGILTDGTHEGDGAVQNNIQQEANGSWSGWRLFSPSGGFSQIDAALLPDNRFVACGVGINGPVWFNRQPVSNGNWIGWENLGGRFSFVQGQCFPDGRYALLAISEGSVSSNWQVKTNGLWGGWQAVGSKNGFTQISVTLLPDSRLVCFGIGHGTPASAIWQTAPKRGWGEWKNLGGPNLLSIRGCKYSDGRLAVFGLSEGTEVWANAQLTPDGTWGEWKQIGSESGFTSIDPVLFPDDRVACLAIDRGAGVSINWQNKSNGNWTGWQTLGGTNYTTVNGVATLDGKLAVFAHGHRTEEWINRRLADETWFGWTSLGGVLK